MSKYLLRIIRYTLSFTVLFLMPKPVVPYLLGDREHEKIFHLSGHLLPALIVSQLQRRANEMDHRSRRSLSPPLSLVGPPRVGKLRRAGWAIRMGKYHAPLYSRAQRTASLTFLICCTWSGSMKPL